VKTGSPGIACACRDVTDARQLHGSDLKLNGGGSNTQGIAGATRPDVPCSRARPSGGWPATGRRKIRASVATGCPGAPDAASPKLQRPASLLPFFVRRFPRSIDPVNPPHGGRRIVYSCARVASSATNRSEISAGFGIALGTPCIGLVVGGTAPCISTRVQSTARTGRTRRAAAAGARHTLDEAKTASAGLAERGQAAIHRLGPRSRWDRDRGKWQRDGLRSQARPPAGRTLRMVVSSRPTRRKIPAGTFP